MMHIRPKTFNLKIAVEQTLHVSILHGVGVLPTRGGRSPYTGGTASLHGANGLPTRSKRVPCAGAWGRLKGSLRIVHKWQLTQMSQISNGRNLY